jgi:hypothetical protein
MGKIITRNRLRGMDFTWSNWLFEKDGTTPSETFEEFERSVRRIRGFYETDESKQ